MLCRETVPQSPVCTDSCVEFFVQPRPDTGYFNFEFNCGGTIHCHYIEDCRRTPAGFMKHRPLTLEELSQVKVSASLPAIVWPERQHAVVWQLDVMIPLQVMEPYIGRTGPLSAQTFAANFYKCADHSSHPHWASWAPIGEDLNFHQPKKFGLLEFE